MNTYDIIVMILLALAAGTALVFLVVGIAQLISYGPDETPEGHYGYDSETQKWEAEAAAKEAAEKELA